MCVGLPGKHAILAVAYGLLVGLILNTPLFGTPWVVDNTTPTIREGKAEATGYRFVKFVLEQNPAGSNLGLWEIEWLNGTVVYPKLALQSTGESWEAKVSAGNPSPTIFNIFRLYDLSKTTGTSLPGGSTNETPVILDFKDHVIYPTAVRITKASAASVLKEFRVEGSNDPAAGWTVIYESPANMDNAVYFPDNGKLTGTFPFGTTPVAVDVAPPPAPVPSTTTVTHNSAQISWPAVVDAGSGIAGYEVFLDGKSQGFTTNTTYGVNYVLKPDTDYTVEVVAYDKEYNASAKGSVAVKTAPAPIAKAYKHFRFWVTATNSNGTALIFPEMRVLMGDRKLPINPISANAGDDDIEISSSNVNINVFDPPYKLFDNDRNTHWYALPGKEFTLTFKTLTAYPTGVEVTLYPFNGGNLQGIRCEGSNDKTNWDVLYDRTNIKASEYSEINGPRTHVRGVFSFGSLPPPDLDVTPPTAPTNLKAVATASTYADVSWNASTDVGTGVSAYKLYVNDALWGTTANTAERLFALSPNTTYAITVKAIDRLGNESAASSSLSVTTSALAPAADAMVMGTDFGSDTAGIWKAGVNFQTEWANYATSNPFNPVFLNEVKNYKILRFMPLYNINNNWVANWSDRRLPTEQDQSSPPNHNVPRVAIMKGIALEWLIRLCNINKSHLWVPVPHAATDDYMRQMAATIKQYLDPSLNVYLEYSNEVFAGFGAEKFATDQGKALGFHQGNFKRYGWFGENEYARFRYYVHRCTQMYTIFNDVFGADQSRVKKVLSGWTLQPNLVRVHLDALADPAVNPTGIYPDYYGLAPYVGINTIDGVSPTLLEDLRTDMRDRVVNAVKEQYAVLANSGFNIPLIAYEGGQHVTKNGEFGNRRPLMYQFCIEFLNAMAPYLESMVSFQHYGGYFRGYAFGTKEYIGQPDHLAFKYRAIQDWIAANVNTPEVKTPTLVEQPQSLTIAEGSGASFKVGVVGQQPMQYQWFENGVAISGATNPTLQLLQVGAEKNGKKYSVRVSNALGQVTSQEAVLTVTAIEKAIAIKATQAITVDGTAEAAWNAATAYPIAKVNSGIVDNDQDLSGSYKVLWDQNNLYLLVKTTDNALVSAANASNIWNTDAVEIYLDATNAKSSAHSPSTKQLLFAWKGTQLTTGSGTMSVANAKVSQVDIAGGYQTEFSFAWADMGVTPANGLYIGLDVMLVDNDAGGGGNKDGKKAWWTTEDLSWSSPAKFGTVKLLDQPPVTYREPENPANTVNGLDYDYHQGKFYSVGGMTASNLVKKGTVTNFTLTPRQRQDYFGFVFSGYVNIPTDGEYTFYTHSDDGSKLFIGTTEVVSNDNLHPPKEVSGKPIALKAGKHAIRVKYFEHTGGETLKVSYAGPGISKQAIPASRLYRLDTQPLATTRTAGEFEEPMIAYPNPADQSVTVQYQSNTPDAVEVTVYNILGSQVYKQKQAAQAGGNTLSVPVNNLQNGQYVLSVTNGKKRQVVKIIVQH